MNIRPLRADEVEVRIGQIRKNPKGKVLGEDDNGVKAYEGKATFLLYKNARVDMVVLDEVFGSQFWQRRHYEHKGNLFCEIGVWNGAIGEWIWKGDCGTESFTEKEKGEASDSFKRAGFCWGIGRELYTAPTIALSCPVVPKKNGTGYELKNPYEFYGMYVKELETDELDAKRVITKLVINQKAQGRDWEVFRYDAYKEKK